MSRGGKRRKRLRRVASHCTTGHCGKDIGHSIRDSTPSCDSTGPVPESAGSGPRRRRAPRRNGATTRTRTRDERRDRDRVRPSGSTRFVQFGVLRIRICSATRKTPDPPVFTTSTGALFIHGLQLLVLPPMQPPGCLTASSIVPQSETLTAVTIHMGSPSVGCGLTSALVTFCHPATGPK